ncbi:hypothetical protein KAH55_07710 [bacterium]|nr:hypothetical protein [bacterium]
MKPITPNWPNRQRLLENLVTSLRHVETAQNRVGAVAPLFSLEMLELKLRIPISATIIAAVAGGVKAGKSTVFQGLCQRLDTAQTGVGHLTHRPLAFLPEKLDPPELAVSTLFPQFDIKAAASANDATRQDVPENRLWFINSPDAKPGTIFIDCPDVNSMNQTNRKLAQQLVKACDLVYLVMLGGANAYSATIKSFASEALAMGRLVFPVFTHMDDAQSARIVLEEFQRELAPMVDGPIEFPFAAFIPNLRPVERQNIKLLKLQSVYDNLKNSPAAFPELDSSKERLALKTHIWNKNYLHFKTRLNAELSHLRHNEAQWRHATGHIDTALQVWSDRAATLIFPRSAVLREILAWYEDTRLTRFRKTMRWVNPLNWPSRIYGIIRKRDLLNQDREELQAKAGKAMMRLQNEFDTLANETWSKIWGKNAPDYADNFRSNTHPVRPSDFAVKLNQLVTHEMEVPEFSREWRKDFRMDLEKWWHSRNESGQRKRRFLEYSQIASELISWLALPATFFLPGTLDTIIVGVTQPIFTFFNEHFIFIETHFIGARQRWITAEAGKLKTALIKNTPDLALLFSKTADWEIIRESLHQTEKTLQEIDNLIEN